MPSPTATPPPDRPFPHVPADAMRQAEADAAAQAFIARWRGASGENANRQLFIHDLCDLLGVPRPDPRRESDDENAYCFERHVTFQNGDGTTSSGNIQKGGRVKLRPIAGRINYTSHFFVE